MRVFQLLEALFTSNADVTSTNETERGGRDVTPSSLVLRSTRCKISAIGGRTVEQINIPSNKPIAISFANLRDCVYIENEKYIITEWEFKPLCFVVAFNSIEVVVFRKFFFLGARQNDDYFYSTCVAAYS